MAYAVVSVPRCVPPYRCSTLLRMLIPLMKLCFSRVAQGPVEGFIGMLHASYGSILDATKYVHSKASPPCLPPTHRASLPPSVPPSSHHRASRAPYSLNVDGMCETVRKSPQLNVLSDCLNFGDQAHHCPRLLLSTPHRRGAYRPASTIASTTTVASTITSAVGWQRGSADAPWAAWRWQQQRVLR